MGTLLLFLSAALQAGVLTAGVCVLLSFPVGSWRPVWRSFRVGCAFALGARGAIVARQALARDTPTQLFPAMLEDGYWLMTYVRFQAQFWGTFFAVLAVVFDFALAGPEQRWFYAASKTSASLLRAVALTGGMLLITWISGAFADWYASKSAIPDSFL